MNLLIYLLATLKQLLPIRMIEIQAFTVYISNSLYLHMKISVGFSAVFVNEKSRRRGKVQLEEEGMNIRTRTEDLVQL